MDAATGVYTKDYMDLYVERLFAEQEVTKYTACSFNIRGMGTLNTEYGEETGTKLLRVFVQGLQERIGDRGIVVRVKGDDFVAVFRTELQDEVVEYLQGMDVESKDGIKSHLASRAGYYVITQNCRNPIELNDILAEAAKEARSNVNGAPFIFYDDKVFQQISESRRIEGMFEDAIRNEEFLVYYQPKVEVRRYRLHGAEALCRWMHEGQMILPYKFIPVFEHNGSIVELDFYMLEHVCRDLRGWLEAGKELVRVSVNLSRGHMGDRHLVEHILEIIDKYEIPHQYIEIELTETSTDIDYAEMRTIVQGLHDAGVHTSVDDFGIGYSSMNLLRELPWNVVKIDRSFVPTGSGDEEDKKKLVMLQAIIQMSERLGFKTIAEGVETAEQVILLKENGCFLIQGFYFDKPLPKKDFEARLAGLTESVRGGGK